MCFSANASFVVGTIIAAIGIASLKKAQSPPQFLFAGIPLIFSVQQITEGFLWLSLSNPAYAFFQQITTYTFLFIAQVVWPLWVPLSISLLEKKEKRKKVQSFLIGAGVLVSLYLAFCLFSYHVNAKISGHHIYYEQDYPPSLSKYGAILYIVATITPPFFSGIKRMWTLGTAILISYIITAVFYKDYVVSVWCFFASIISIAVVAVMYEIKKSDI